MSNRRYSEAEIGQMRQALTTMLRPISEATDFDADNRALTTRVEEHLGDYMRRGTDPGQLETHAKTVEFDLLNNAL